MESSPYLAHISATGQTQTVFEHLCGTASLARDFARPFGGEEQAELAGLAHDIGKYSQAFQKRLRGAPIQVEHSTAGAVECWRRGQPFAAFAVAGHHGGLPDGGSQADVLDQATFLGRIKRNEKGALEPSELGCTPAWKLFDLVKVDRKDADTLAPARCYQDYIVTVDESALPVGVTCQRMG